MLPHLCLLRELKCVDAVSKVGRERVVKLAQRLLQRLKRLFVLLQCLQLLLQTDLPVHRLEDTPSSTCMCHETHGFQHSGILTFRLTQMSERFVFKWGKKKRLNVTVTI